jgi:Tfp pilus assembly pilus retraction ATPase PilT
VAHVDAVLLDDDDSPPAQRLLDLREVRKEERNLDMGAALRRAPEEDDGWLVLVTGTKGSSRSRTASAA